MTVPEHDVEVQDVSDVPPEPTIEIDFVPSSLWLTVTVFRPISCQVLLFGRFIDFVIVFFVPLIVRYHVPLPVVAALELDDFRASKIAVTVDVFAF